MTVTQESQGFTLLELLVAAVVAAMALMVGAAISVPWMARETTRQGLYDVQVMMQQTKMEALARNRDCRFVLDTSSGTIQVWDGQGTPARGDDALLRARTLPNSVVLARPDPGQPITLAQIGGGDSYETVFSSDGAASQGDGSVFLHSGDFFGRLSVFGAGGLRIERWNGSSWEVAY